MIRISLQTDSLRNTGRDSTRQFGSAGFRLRQFISSGDNNQTLYFSFLDQGISMSIARISGFALSIVMVATLFSSISSARRPLRWLGQGFSDGYHRCTPGPNSDYYNPYTAHNSMLISRNPGMYGLPQQRSQFGPIESGIPFSVYAAPAPVDGSKAFQALPGQAIDNSFVPYEGKKSTDSNDWVPENSDGDDSKETKAEKDAAAYAPSLQGRVEFGMQTRNAAAASGQVNFSKAGFQNSPSSQLPIGELVDERVEDRTNLFNPFESQK